MSLYSLLCALSAGVRLIGCMVHGVVEWRWVLRQRDSSLNSISATSQWCLGKLLTASDALFIKSIIGSLKGLNEVKWQRLQTAFQYLFFSWLFLTIQPPETLAKYMAIQFEVTFPASPEVGHGHANGVLSHGLWAELCLNYLQFRKRSSLLTFSPLLTPPPRMGK